MYGDITIGQTKKIGKVLDPKEKKPPIVNNQCVVYKFECDLCKEDNVRYTALHLHQRISAHKCSAIGKHLEQHGLLRTGMVDMQFSALKKCRSKFGCLIFEMLFIKELNPEINTHKNNVEAPAPASAPAPGSSGSQAGTLVTLSYQPV